MKNGWMITFRSVTYAQRAEQTLKRAGVRCVLQRTPAELSTKGCGYGLRIPAHDGPQALALLKKSGAVYIKVYVRNGERMEEQAI